MEYSSLPLAPQKRRAILIISDGELRDIQNNVHRDSTASKLLYNNQVSLLNIDALTPDAIEGDSLVKSLSTSGDLLNTGNLLVQSPYNTQDYIDASKAYYAFARKKWDIFTYFWGFLGAKEASVKLEEIHILDTKVKGSGKVSSTGISGKLQGEKQAHEKVKKEMDLKKNYRALQGNLIIDKARTYIRERQWLFSDYDFEAAIEIREAGISMEAEEFSMTITQESQTNLKLALSLNVPTFISLNLNFEEVKEEIFSFSLKTRVEFW